MAHVIALQYIFVKHMEILNIAIAICSFSTRPTKTGKLLLAGDGALLMPFANAEKSIYSFALGELPRKNVCLCTRNYVAICQVNSGNTFNKYINHLRGFSTGQFLPRLLTHISVCFQII